MYKFPLHLVRADAGRGQKRASDPRHLELEAVNVLKWVLALDLVLPKSSKGSSLLSHRSNPMEKALPPSEDSDTRLKKISYFSSPITLKTRC